MALMFSNKYKTNKYRLKSNFYITYFLNFHSLFFFSIKKKSLTKSISSTPLDKVILQQKFDISSTKFDLSSFPLPS